MLLSTDVFRDPTHCELVEPAQTKAEKDKGKSDSSPEWLKRAAELLNQK